MHIKRDTEEQWKNTYNTWCRSLLGLCEEGALNPFGFTECKIEPCSETTPHFHDDTEMFFMIQGEGLMSINGETRKVSNGDAILIAPRAVHSLKNTSATKELHFLSVAWISPPAVTLDNHPTLIIPAPPTPNGELHLGHLSGPYLAADVYRRYLTFKGKKAAVFVGTDDHQCYIGNKARTLNVANSVIVEQFRPLIHQGLRNFLVDPDHIIAPFGDAEYCDFIAKFFQRLVDNKTLVLRSAPTVFCNNINQFIFGADVNGHCPHCQHRTLGHGCEHCGYYNDNHDLINLRSIFGDKEVSLLQKERYYFALNDHRDFLRDMLASCTMHPRLRSFYDAYLVADLPNMSASHYADWGIDAPNESGQKIYEWIEMAGAYAYCIEKARKRFDAQRLNLVQAFGFDNSFFYGFVVPALINAYDPNLPTPKIFLSNYFYLLNHEKFSTSRRHAIWANDLFEKVSPDVVRFYLALTRAEDKPTNFSLADFRAFMTTEINDRWHEFFVLLNRDIGDPTYQLTEVKKLKGYQERFFVECEHLKHRIDEAYGIVHSLQSAADYLTQLLHHVMRFYERNRFNADDKAANLSIALAALNVWANMLEPIMPTLARAIRRKPEEPVSAFDLSFFIKSANEVAILDERL